MTASKAWPKVAVAAVACVPLAFVGVFFLLPLGGMLARGFVAEGGGLDLSGVPEVLARARTLRVLTFTLAIAAAGTVLTVVIALPVAF
ncbi:MAG: iron ABC transporter permease, partial [Ornithinimicrobium sp.]